MNEPIKPKSSHPIKEVSALEFSNKDCSCTFAAIYKNDPETHMYSNIHQLSVTATNRSLSPNATGSFFSMELKISEIARFYFSLFRIMNSLESDDSEEKNVTIAQRRNHKSLILQRRMKQNKKAIYLYMNVNTTHSCFINIQMYEVVLVMAKLYEVMKLSFSTISDEAFQKILSSYQL